MKPVGTKDAQYINTVDDLTDYSGKEWDVSTLQRVFHENDVEDIRQIAVGGLGREDVRAWNYTKNGQFTVRSAYHLEMKIKALQSGSPESSSSAAMHAGWNELWSTEVPGKAKIHCWRLLKNGLAVGAELHRRRIKPGIFCLACGREENVLHRFWKCPYAKFYWELVRTRKGITADFRPPDFVGSQQQLAGWLLDWIGKSKEP